MSRPPVFPVEDKIRIVLSVLAGPPLVSWRLGFHPAGVGQWVDYAAWFLDSQPPAPERGGVDVERPLAAPLGGGAEDERG